MVEDESKQVVLGSLGQQGLGRKEQPCLGWKNFHLLWGWGPHKDRQEGGGGNK